MKASVLLAAAAGSFLFFSPAPLPAQEAGVTPSGKHEIVVTGSDLAAITAAIEALPAEGGTVFLPAGRYLLDGPVLLDRDNVTLRGAGPETILFVNDDANCPGIVMGVTDTPITKKVRNLAVSDLLIDGNRHTQKLECWTCNCDNGGLSYIRNNCITVRGVEDSRIERVKTTRGRSGGVVLEKECRRVIIEKLEAWDNHFDGLACYETEESVFTGLHLHHNQFAAISLDIHFHKNAIVNSLLEHNGAQGIFMRESNANVFQNLTIRYNGAQGIFVAQVDQRADTGCQGNVFSGLRFEHMTGEAFRVNDPSCTGNILGHSVFQHNARGDVSEALSGLIIQANLKISPSLP